MMQRKTLLIAFVFLLVFIVSCTVDSPSSDPLTLNLRDYEQLAMHIHPTLEISILGEKQTIPANIGYSEQEVLAIHTHDTTGELHVEAPFPHQFYLKDFFILWAKTFNEDCIFDYCTDEDHSLQVFINGVQDSRYEDTPLNDEDAITIIYSKK